jgi:ABC-type antimicrobial peptide transport system permease subunit
VIRFLLRNLQMALNGLRRNVLRAVLTTLGIVIGVAAVIAMMEIGQGSSRGVQESIARMGANNLMIFAGSAMTGGISQGAGSATTLTLDDVEAILDRCPSVTGAAPIVRARTQVVHGNRNWRPSYIYGTTSDFLVVRDWQDMEEGQPFSDEDVRRGNSVCLIGLTGAQELFGEESALNKEIRINGKPFKIIGVLGRKGASMTGWDQDDILLAPWKAIRNKVVGQSMGNQNQTAAPTDPSQQPMNTLNKLYPNQQQTLYPLPSPAQIVNTPQQVRFSNIDQINVSAASAEMVPQAIEEIREVLRERHKLEPDQADDFYVRDMSELSKALGTTAQQMGRLLPAIALISLIVGGVGIMNIMLVSVMERTREVGLRMAVGARARDILTQFLVESILLCLIGGVLGCMIGRGVSWSLWFFKGWSTEFAPLAYIAAVVVSAGVGIIFGFYPAWKASCMDPIEALRYE